jgi:hypothetical protein
MPPSIPGRVKVPTSLKMTISTSLALVWPLQQVFLKNKFHKIAKLCY